MLQLMEKLVRAPEASGSRRSMRIIVRTIV
jgi:hypothetical protein